MRPLYRGLPRRCPAPRRGDFFLDEGCLGCGRCAAVCPMGAIAVAGFALRPSKIKVTRPLTLDCWKVPTKASPAHSVRVPCLGGLSPGQWLGLVLAAHGDAPDSRDGGGRAASGTAAEAATSPAPPGHTACACCGPGVKLLDRGWCGACPANPGAAHPAAAALTVVHGWLKEARVPRQYWPWLARAPLPAARAVAPDPRNEAPVNRRNFFGALVHESVGLANAALDAPRAEERHRKSGAERNTAGTKLRHAIGAEDAKCRVRTRRWHRPNASACSYSWRRSRPVTAATCRHRSIRRSRSTPTASTIACARHYARPARCAPTPIMTAWESRTTRPVASPAASASRPVRNTPSICNPPGPERTRSLRLPPMPPDVRDLRRDLRR